MSARTRDHYLTDSGRARGLKARLLDEYGPVCCWCGIESDRLTVEHLVPRARAAAMVESGVLTPEEAEERMWSLRWLRLACQPCNASRGTRLGPPPRLTRKLREIRATSRHEGAPGW